jgi:GntR family transcriptional repressor for pyruvate dehydrogenase complex/GntR family L-lactate dehydrogenase operon transcriptional regulator
MHRQKLSDQIAEQLEGMIADGTLKPGERLPAERPLSERLGISRPSLREAIQKLASKGLLNTRQGGGTFVTDNLSSRFSDPLLALLKDQPNAEFDTLEVRKELEGVAAYNAATRATESDRERIWGRFSRMAEVQRSHASSLDKLQVDGDFHQSIIEGAHNIVLVHFMRAVRDVLENTINSYLDEFYATPKFVELICRQHQDIVTAIMDHDPEAAREKAKYHLDFAYQSFREFQQQARLSRNAELYSAIYQNPRGE